MLHGLFCFLCCSNVKCCGLCLACPFYTFITWSVPLLSRASFLLSHCAIHSFPSYLLVPSSLLLSSISKLFLPIVFAFKQQYLLVLDIDLRSA